MHWSNLLHQAFFLLLALSPPPTHAKSAPKNAILLSSVKSLTLRQNAKTSHRRVSAVPQLKCVGPGCAHYQVDIMRCANQGAEYESEDIQWSCKASLPEEFKLGSTEVVCEGYDGPTDPYVLKGSCGVEYRLLLTDKGSEKYGSGGFGSGLQGVVRKAFSWGFTLIFVTVAGWILYSMLIAYTQNTGRELPRRAGFGGGWGGGGGGGGGGGEDPWDPPPPYSGKKYPSSSQQSEGWQPGFWSGALGGAAAGYMAGNRSQQRQQPPPQRGSWFGRGSSTNQPSNSSSSSSSSSGSSPSSTRHESTGYGSTSRR